MRISVGELFPDNRRDFTQMGQTDFKSSILSIQSVIIDSFNHLFLHFFSSELGPIYIFIFHNLINQSL